MRIPMETIMKPGSQLRAAISIILSLVLTGCPDYAAYRLPDETTSVIKTVDGICFKVSDAGDYQPSFISINPRGTPSKEQQFTSKPNLQIKNGQLCVPPSFYKFPDNGQFLADYVLRSKTRENSPRNVVVGFELRNGHLYSIELTNIEISRPYRSEDE
jgi:hypothetical protein